MDNAVFGQFAELVTYKDRAEYEAWLEDQSILADDAQEWPDDVSGEEDNAHLFLPHKNPKGEK